jgi:hypothetical protein
MFGLGNYGKWISTEKLKMGSPVAFILTFPFIPHRILKDKNDRISNGEQAC